MKTFLFLAASMATLILSGCGTSDPVAYAPASDLGSGTLSFSYSGARTGAIQADGSGGNPGSWSAPGIWPETLLPRPGVTARTYTLELRRGDSSADSPLSSGVGVHHLVMICQSRNGDGTVDQLTLLLSRYDSMSAGGIHLISSEESYRAGDFQWPVPFAGMKLQAKVRLLSHISASHGTIANLPNCFTSVDNGATTIRILGSSSANGIDRISGVIDADLVNPQGEHVLLQGARFTVDAPRDNVGLY